MSSRFEKPIDAPYQGGVGLGLAPKCPPTVGDGFIAETELHKEQVWTT